MAGKSFEEVYKELGSRIILEDGETKAIAPSIQRVAKNGWRRVTLTGSPEMCRLAWLEAKMHDLEVLGYSPTSKDLKELERIRIERGGLETMKTIDKFLAIENSMKVTKR